MSKWRWDCWNYTNRYSMVEKWEVDNSGRTWPPKTSHIHIRMDLPTAEGLRKCPFEGCRGQAETRTAMRVQFLHIHVRDTVIILEEENLPHPRVTQCDILVPWKALNGRHVTTTQCTKRAERRIWRLAEEEIRDITERDFHAYSRNLETVTSFK